MTSGNDRNCHRTARRTRHAEAANVDSGANGLTSQASRVDCDAGRALAADDAARGNGPIVSRRDTGRTATQVGGEGYRCILGSSFRTRDADVRAHRSLGRRWRAIKHDN